MTNQIEPTPPPAGDSAGYVVSAGNETFRLEADAAGVAVAKLSKKAIFFDDKKPNQRSE